MFGGAALSADTSTVSPWTARTRTRWPAASPVAPVARQRSPAMRTWPDSPDQSSTGTAWPIQASSPLAGRWRRLRQAMRTINKLSKRVVGHAQGHGIVLAGDPGGEAILVRDQPGIGARPATGQTVQPAFRQVLEKKFELLDAVGHQDQALFHRPRLERQQAKDRLAVPGPVGDRGQSCEGR